MRDWSPYSWQEKKWCQRPFGCEMKEEQVIEMLKQLSPVVAALSVDKLRSLLVRVEKGEVFLLQGGDCAELFKNCTLNYIAQQVNTLQQIALSLESSLKQSVSIIGRMGGQFAKPRSSLTEKRGDVVLPGYFGDLINTMEFNAASRQPKPELMLSGLYYSQITVEYVKEILLGCQMGRLGDGANAYERSFFNSHEALLLPYEEALTRYVNGRWYNLSTHFPWIGLRTSEPDGAHVEYMRGITNPIGIKIGPEIVEEKLNHLINILNPSNAHGKIVLIYRLGVKCIEKKLPLILNTIKKMDRKVLLMCDPMHGNTEKIDGKKIRHVNNIISELTTAVRVHRECGVQMSGIHLEVTGENVIECIEEGNTEYDTPTVDPRLNKEQALRVVKEVFHKQRHPVGNVS
jgi:3-deoxy-7-phosphoheptulonate synthase